jgi:hypothetical protein
MDIKEKTMKEYFEFKDGTCWVIRVKGNACYTAYGDRYEDFWPEHMILADSKKAKRLRLPPGAAKKTFAGKTEAEAAARAMIQAKAKKALPQTPEFWLTAVELDGRRLFFVPNSAKTGGLCELAVRRDGDALRYVPAEKRTPCLCRLAVHNSPCALQYVPEDLKTAALCEAAVSDSGSVLRYVPESLKTRALCETAVRHRGLALEFVPEALKPAPSAKRR